MVVKLNLETLIIFNPVLKDNTIVFIDQKPNYPFSAFAFYIRSG